MDWVCVPYNCQSSIQTMTQDIIIRYYNQQTFGSILNVLCKNVWLSNILMKHEKKKYQY